jgi:hypothetical protein
MDQNDSQEGIVGSWFRVPLIMGFLVQLDNAVYFGVFIYTLHVSGIHHQYRQIVKPTAQFAVTLLRMGDQYPKHVECI